ncbi:MAG: TlpA family protein disulfide reductase [Nitrospirota bacterium]
MKIKTLSLILLTIFLYYGSGYAAWIGDKAPSFSLKRLDNNGSLSLKEFEGKILFIDFWATWCGPCKKELPALDSLMKEYNDSLVILAINLDKKKGKIKKFLEKYPVDLPVLLDPEGNIVSKYGARAMPTSFIIDGNGTIKFVHLGFSKKDTDKWRKEIDSILSENLAKKQ